MGVVEQRHATAALPARKRSGTHSTRGWVVLRAGLDGCGKFRPPTEFDLRTVQPVASQPTTLSGLLTNLYRAELNFRISWWSNAKLRTCKCICGFLSFFLSLSDHFCLLIVGVEGYCCTWSHSLTRTHSGWLSWMRDRPVAEAPNCTTQHSQETNIHASGGKMWISRDTHFLCRERD